MFETVPNPGAELIDFVFKVGATQENIRLESRTANLLSGNSWEFQIGSAGTAQLLVGNSIVKCTATLVLNADPTANMQAVTKQYCDAAVRTRPSPLSFPFPGKPLASGKINVAIPWAVSIPANFAGSVTYESTLPTASAVFTVNKISGGALTQIGTVTLTTASNTSCTLSGSATTLAVGDVLQVVAPSTQDGALADVSITIYAVLQ